MEPLIAVGDVDPIEHREQLPVDHPIRKIRVVVDTLLDELDPVIEAMNATSGPQRAIGTAVGGDGVDGDVLDPFRAPPQALDIRVDIPPLDPLGNGTSS